MSSQRLVHARGPADLLALVPGLLGFHPEESVVVLTVGDAEHAFHARVDLPQDPVALDLLAEHLTRVAVRNGVRRLVCVVYSGDAGLAEAVAVALAARAVAAGVEPVCSLRADGSHWWLLGDGAPPDRPGTPYDVATHPLTTRALVEGTVVLASRRELAASLVGRDPAEAARMAALADRAADRVQTLLGSAPDSRALRRRLAREGRWVRSRVRRFLEDRRRLGEDDAARLVTLLTVSVEVRDVAWAEMDHRRAAAHVDLWRDLVRRVPAEVRAAPAALLGFAAWLSGDGALAWCAVECAERAEPGYGLAGLLSTALEEAVPPSAWTPFPRETLTLFDDSWGPG